MVNMVNEMFNNEELIQTFKLGPIKIIPKKGDAKKIGDRRPRTLLSCGYKVMSEVVANRLERYLMKIIGRAQKGFLKRKRVYACTVNVMSIIGEAWEHKEQVGVMCMDERI